MKKEKITIGLFGFGCVGQGLYEVLNKTRGLKADIKKICIKHADKPRPIDQRYFTLNKDDILFDPEIDVVVELIDNADEAFEIAKTALQNKKSVVSASKKMIAEHLEELYSLQEENGAAFLYEGSCCASIPIIRNLEEYYDNDLLNSIEGIFNGSTNYILTRMAEEGSSFEDALKEAQDKGFAETDPSLDVDAFDAKFKLSIIALHTFGMFVGHQNILHYGIRHINQFDLKYARQNDYKIKLVARCEKNGSVISAWVFPKFVKNKSKLAYIDYEFNGITVESVFSEKQFFSGKGAGGNPTGSAVLSDISALSYDYRYEYKKYKQNGHQTFTQNKLLKAFLRYRNGDKPDTSHFNKIIESYESPQYNYIIGEINLPEIFSSGWLNRAETNVLLLDE
jgi:homoserine dehydrogenase